MITTIAALIPHVHRIALEHGWWDDCRPDKDSGAYDNNERLDIDTAKVRALIPEKLALIHSEISECLECYRRGEMKTYYAANNGSPSISPIPPPACGKPEGFPVELADVVIRCADLAGALGVSLKKGRQRWTKGLSIPAAMHWLHCYVANTPVTTYTPNVVVALENCVSACFDLAAEHGIDLWQAINTKSAFNETRPYRHGGRKC